MAISHDQVPSGGWEYTEKRTNIRIVATTWQRLVMHVTAHRKSNGIDVGDVEGDVDRQIEEAHPELHINGDN